MADPDHIPTAIAESLGARLLEDGLDPTLAAEYLACVWEEIQAHVRAGIARDLEGVWEEAGMQVAALAGRAAEIVEGGPRGGYPEAHETGETRDA